MGMELLLSLIIETGKERISPELQQQIGVNLNEWNDKSKISKNPWDKVVVAVSAELFNIKLN